MRILWIEDKYDHIRRFVELLRGEHEVVVAGTGEQALAAIETALIENDPYNVVILDIMLPKGEGQRIDVDMRPELMGVEILCRMDKPEIGWPVVGVSAIADEQLRRTISEDYPFVVEVLKKPVKMDELRIAISRATDSAN